MLLNNKLLRSERGNTMMIVAAVMPMLVGAGAIGIDVAQWTLAKRHLQRMADTAAIAGANGVMQKGDQASLSAAQAAANQSLAHNNQIDGTTVLVENAPSAGSYAGDPAAVRVIVTATAKLSFAQFFLSRPTTASAEATAKGLPDPRYCLLALDDLPNSAGFDLSGASGITTDCGLMTNSKKKPSAYEFGGNASLVNAPSVSSTGAIGSGNWGSTTQRFPFQAKEQDPYKDAPEASTFGIPCNGGTVVVEGGQWNNRQLTPGCWTNLSIRRSIVLAEGTYVVRAGTLEFTSNASVTATGPVTFVLTGDSSNTIAKVTMTGGAHLNLSAPTDGPLKDLLFYQDRRARHTWQNTFTGNAGSVFNGGIYFPGSALNYTGNSSTTAVCARIVAARIAMTGSSAINISCSGQNDKNFGYQVRLVA
jgi:Flp pilus assembly protein TadG